MTSIANRFRATKEKLEALLAAGGASADDVEMTALLIAGLATVAPRSSARPVVQSGPDLFAETADVPIAALPAAAPVALRADQEKIQGLLGRPTEAGSSVGALLKCAFAETEPAASDIAALLELGIRPIRPCRRLFVWHDDGREALVSGRWRPRTDALPDNDPPRGPCRCSSCWLRGRPTPRLHPGGGIWMTPVVFRDTIGGHRLARRSRTAVRFGSTTSKAAWLPREAIDDGGG